MNELVSNNHSYGRKFKEVEHLIHNIKRNEPFINIEYGDLKNSLILDSDEGKKIKNLL